MNVEILFSDAKTNKKQTKDSPASLSNSKHLMKKEMCEGHAQEAVMGFSAK